MKLIRQSLSLEQLVGQIETLQEQFGMSTEKFLLAYGSGELPETPEFREWSVLHSAFESIAHKGHVAHA